MSDRQQRNMVQRLDGRLVNAGRKRGMLIVCATGCCCGHTERGFAPVWHDLYHNEWERRRLRNRVHLNMGGCLGPCPLANVALLLFDGSPIWFHSLNEPPLILALYDYIEAMLAADRTLPAPELLAPHVFNGFAWDQGPRTTQRVPDQEPRTGCVAAQYSLRQPGTENQEPGTDHVGAQYIVPQQIVPGERIVLLTQADTDLLTLEQARSHLPAGFLALYAAHIGRQAGDEAIDLLLDEALAGAGVVILRLLSGARSFARGLERLQAWAAASGGFLLALPAADALDPELMARSTIGVPLAHLISAYFQAGGAENLANGLQCLSDHLLLTGWGYDPPRELPRHGIYHRQNREPRTENRGSGSAHHLQKSRWSVVSLRWSVICAPTPM